MKNPVHYAEFEFRPTYSWSKKGAKRMYEAKQQPFFLSSHMLNQVLYEDCIQGMQKIPSNIIDLVIADPPFGISFSGLDLGYNRKKELVIKGYNEIAVENYSKFTAKWVSQLPRLLREHASVWVFSGWNNLEYILTEFRKNDFELIEHIIWKYSFGKFSKRQFVKSHYHLLRFSVDSKNCFFNLIEWYPEDVWYIKKDYAPGKKKNGTKLPEEILRKILRFSSKPGDFVLDPFMGNGTTGRVCKKEFRHFIGFEINPNAKPIIDEALNIIPGESYIPDIDQIPSIQELAQRKGYRKAFKKYCKDHNLVPSQILENEVIN